MFTGIVSDIGRVRAIEPRGDMRIVIETTLETDTLALGASIACAGCCLTVVAKGPGWFAVDASAETLRCTTLGGWRPGAGVNLERALRVGDELGGHMVLGHVDGLGEIVEREGEGDSVRFTIAAPPALMSHIAAKGSIAADGVSLTVNAVAGQRFTVNLIPHTLAATTFGGRRPGDAVNLEIDVLARYVSRLMEAR